ncbi:acyltransferase [Methylobacterium sp.]|uniref:acyltransferase family protein n=1 Tax=Methylobacterium sp. TaxID=409 RepID=UPI000C37C32A|nr:acyltransferase [Methylobacterium sp.]MBP28011.1 acyltransferase [Methylobacterium sp.]
MPHQGGEHKFKSHAQMLGLDVARFLAAALVMMFHLAAYAWQAPSSTAGRAFAGAAQYPGLFAWTWFGWGGVELFFVISGFVIAYSAAHTTPPSFLRSRILRLVPAVWLCATLTLLISLAIGRMGSGRYILHAYLDSVLFWPFEPWIDGVYWTLGVEISFYALVFALLCTQSFRRIGAVCAAIGTISALFWWVTLLAPNLADVAGSRLAQLTLLRHGCFFSLGVFLWLVLTKAVTPGRLAMIALCLGAGLIEISDSSRDFLGQMGRAGAQTPLVPCLLFAVCILAMAASVRWNAWLCAHAGDRTCRLVRTAGLMTYPLYLTHNVNGAALTHFLVTALGFGPLAALVTSCGTMLAISFAIVRWPEPVLRRNLAALLAKVRLGEPMTLATNS